MPKEIFPECHEAYEAAGTVNKECAEQTGLKEGIKIAYGGGDTLMQGVGNGIIRPGILAANIGTSCQISGGFNEPLYDEKIPDQYILSCERRLMDADGSTLKRRCCAEVADEQHSGDGIL